MIFDLEKNNYHTKFIQWKNRKNNRCDYCYCWLRKCLNNDERLKVWNSVLELNLERIKLEILRELQQKRHQQQQDRFFIILLFIGKKIGLQSDKFLLSWPHDTTY